MCRHFPDVIIRWIILWRVWRVLSVAQSADLPSRPRVLISTKPNTTTTITVLWSVRTVCSCPRRELHFSDGESLFSSDLSPLTSLPSGPPRPPSSSPPRTTKMFTRSQPMIPVQTVSGPRGTLPTPTLPIPREEAVPPGRTLVLVRTLSSPVSLPT